MANIHEVLIRGTVPFHLGGETDSQTRDKLREEMVKFVGHFNMPGYGFRLRWTGPIGATPNKFGGKTSMFKFELSGEEAEWPSYIEKFIKAVLALEGGKIEIAKIRDVENNSDWWTIPNPTVAAPPSAPAQPESTPF